MLRLFALISDSQLIGETSQIQRSVQQLEAQLASMPGNAFAQMALTQQRQQFDQVLAANVTLRVHLHDPQFLHDVMPILQWSANFIVWNIQKALANPQAAAATAPAVSQATSAATASTAVASPSATASSSSSSASSNAVTSGSAHSLLARSLIGLIPESVVEDLLIEFPLYSQLKRAISAFDAIQSKCRSDVSRQLTLLNLCLIFFVFPAAHFQPQAFQDYYDSLNGICSLLITVGSGPAALRNVHLRGKFTELLQQMTPHDESDLGCKTQLLFMSHAGLRSRLMPTLLDIFVECESGDHSQFCGALTR